MQMFNKCLDKKFALCYGLTNCSKSKAGKKDFLWLMNIKV